MKWTKYFIPTLREEPKEAEIISHKLMLRAGMIQKLSGGLYSFLPLGMKVLNKVMNIIREELNESGALELLMPVLQPKELWEESGRYKMMGELMMKIKNREDKEFIVAPTHEEIITDIVRKSINSYKQLPINLYQMQVKFRDELRPRFGVIRSKEFIMKDGYSFHITDVNADKEYENMYKTYSRVFTRCGLNFKAIEADTGVMGGYKSHEFTVPASAGEDVVVECSQCGYASNSELAKRKPDDIRHDVEEMPEIEEVETPNMKKVEELTSFFNTGAENFIKTLIYKKEDEIITVLVRGDLEVSEPKLRHLLKSSELTLADESTINDITGAPMGFSGPIGLDGVKIIADKSIKGMTNAITGANKENMHIKNVFIERDLNIEEYFDIGIAVPGDSCINCAGKLKFSRGIEVGQIFKLGTKYSKKMNAVYQDKDGNLKPMYMGCYGIGVTRTIAAIIETNNDSNGIIWPKEVAPFKVLILPTNYSNEDIKEIANGIYKELIELNIDVLFDDRDESAGIKFKDADLIGIPLIVVIGRNYIKDKKIEIKYRKDGTKEMIEPDSIVNMIKDYLTNLRYS